MKQFLLFTVISALFFSCTPMKKIVYLNENSESVIPEVSATKHKLQEGDVLHIKVLGVQEEAFSIFNVENNANNVQTTSANLYMNGFTINSKGIIEIPTIGNISVVGLTTEEAKEKIQKRADEFLINSTVIVKHINFEITVLGEVSRPGTYTIYKDHMTVFEALGLAGDLTDYGKRDNIKRIRGKDISIIDLTSTELLSSSSFYLNSGDVLYIEPIKEVRMRNSKAQIYFSSIASISIITNILLNLLITN